MTERFTEVLRRASEPTWSQAVQHRFVTELFAGTIPDRVMAGYLIRDHRFLDSFLTLLGAAIATADSFEARLHFGRFVGMVSGEENTLFPARFRSARSHGETARRSAGHQADGRLQGDHA